MKPEIDTSTINKDELEKLPIFKCPASYHLQNEPGGNCCYLDPPGYPTYFTRSVYTSHGNSPAKGPQMTILGRVCESENDWNNVADYEKYREKIDKRLKKLWIPLSLEHPRTKAWIIALYKHMHNCYKDDSIIDGDKTLIFPVPSYKLKSFHDDKRFSEEWRIKEVAAINQANAETIARAKLIAIPENHSAVRSIQEFYPEYKPDLELIANPPKEHPGNWWERYSEKMSPEDCPGEHGHKHPVNGTWCQVCGIYQKEEGE